MKLCLAGIYNLLNPQPAAELGDRKAANVLATGAQLLVRANPGCLMQVTFALRPTGVHQADRHDPVVAGVPAGANHAGDATGKVVLADFRTYTCINWPPLLRLLSGLSGEYEAHGSGTTSGPERDHDASSGHRANRSKELRSWTARQCLLPLLTAAQRRN